MRGDWGSRYCRSEVPPINYCVTMPTNYQSSVCSTCKSASDRYVREHPAAGTFFYPPSHLLYLPLPFSPIPFFFFPSVLHSLTKNTIQQAMLADHTNTLSTTIPILLPYGNYIQSH